MLVTNCTCSLSRFFPWHFLVLPTNSNDKGLNVILAAGFFCPLMQTPFALSSMFLGCRFCKHSTLVNWTYWMLNKPSLTVWKSPAKKIAGYHIQHPNLGSKNNWVKVAVLSLCPTPSSHSLLLVFQSFSYNKRGTLQTNTLTICRDKSIHLLT